jgi:hypothetical protein
MSGEQQVEMRRPQNEIHRIRRALFNFSRRTPELTRAEHIAFKMKKPHNDERKAIEASGSMSCWAAR